MIHGDRVFDCMHYICRNGRGRPDDGSMDDYISAVHGDRFFPGDGSVLSIKEKVVQAKTSSANIKKFGTE